MGGSRWLLAGAVTVVGAAFLRKWKNNGTIDAVLESVCFQVMHLSVLIHM